MLCFINSVNARVLASSPGSLGGGEREPDTASHSCCINYLMTMAECRICSSAIGCSHCIFLFSEEGAKSNLASRMAKLQEIPIFQEDNLSALVCQSYKGKFLTLETKLESMHTIAKSLYQICYPTDQQSSSRKHTKVTSGDGVSPSAI